jgi:hypothetical protein
MRARKNTKNILSRCVLILILKRGNLLKLKPLTQDDIVHCQKRGYFDEHLVTLYSVTYGEPYICQNKYLLYHDPLSRIVWLTLFRLDNADNTSVDVTECFEASVKAFQPNKVITTSPTLLPPNLGDFHSETVYQDKDYHINLQQFDEKLNGGSYKHLRYRVNNAEKRGYTLAVGKELTVAHSRIIALHLTKKNYASWDYQLYLRLGEYFKRFSSPRLFNVFSGGILIGFDVVDLLADTMATPLGFYLDYPSLADFLIHKEILQGKRQGLKWLDIGWACNNPGLEAFKKKWTAILRFSVCMQEYQKVNKSERMS